MNNHRIPPGSPRRGNGEGGEPPRPGTREYWCEHQRIYRERLSGTSEESRAKRREEVRRDGILWRYIWRPPYWWNSENGIRRLTIDGFRRQHLDRENLSVAGVDLARPLSQDVVRLLLDTPPIDILRQDARFDTLTEAERVAFATSVATYIWTMLSTKLRRSPNEAAAQGARQALRYLREYPDFPLDDPKGFIERAFLFTEALSLEWRENAPEDCRGALTGFQALGCIIGRRVHALPFELPPGSWTHFALHLRKREETSRLDPSATPDNIRATLLKALTEDEDIDVNRYDLQRYGPFYVGMARLFPPLRALNFVDTMTWFSCNSRREDDNDIDDTI